MSVGTDTLLQLRALANHLTPVVAGDTMVIAVQLCSSCLPFRDYKYHNYGLI